MKKSHLKNIILEAYQDVLFELNEAPDHLYYIKAPRRNKALMNSFAQTIETFFDAKITDIVDDDGNGNVIMYFPKKDYDPGMIKYFKNDIPGNKKDKNDFLKNMSNLPVSMNESLIDELIEEEEPTPEEPASDVGPVLEDATDQILSKFPTLKSAIIKLQTEDFKEFVESVDWISPRPTSFRINLKNGQDYILKWTGSTFEAQIMGKRYIINKISDYQQALDKLNILYKEAPMSGAGEEDAETPEFDSGGGGGGGDFPGGDAAGGGEDLGGDDAGGDIGGAEGGEDLSDEPIDFEAGEEG